MKLVIASDIHGSDYWCGRLMEEIEKESPDKVVLLGDLLYHGPRNDLPKGHGPKAVVDMLNSIAGRVLAVRGNCEAEVDQMVLDFPCMADYLVLMDGSHQIYFTHGHLWSPDNLPALTDGSSFVFGHTHVKMSKDIALPTGGNVYVFNPGSVSLPKDKTNSFAVYEDGEFSFRVLD